MLGLDVVVREGAAVRVLTHLTSAPEMVAFMRGVLRGDVIDIEDVRLLDADELELEEWHVTLRDDARIGILTWAAGADVLVEVHSHGPLGGPAVLSPTDLDGLASWVPHLMWRLPGVVYVSLVSGGGTFDGLAWRADRPTIEVRTVTFRGIGDWPTTGLSLKRLQGTGRE